MNLDKYRKRANVNRGLAVFLFILAGLTVVHGAVTYTPETGMHAVAWFVVFVTVANFLLLDYACIKQLVAEIERLRSEQDERTA